MVKFRDAASAFKTLNGLLCVYKPPNVSVKQVQHTIVTNLCRDLNALPDRPLEKRVEIVGATNEPMAIKLVPNYADDPRVCGPRYIHEDFRCSWATHLGLFSSGLLLLGINDGTKLTYYINVARHTRAYKVHGQLGKATDTYFWNGKTIERSTYKHVTREKLDSVVAHIQAAHQKTMYQHIDVIENKANNSLVLKEKQLAWANITTKYNAVASSGPRTWAQLRHLYENLKQRTKKKVAVENRQQFYEKEADKASVSSISLKYLYQALDYIPTIEERPKHQKVACNCKRKLQNSFKEKYFKIKLNNARLERKFMIEKHKLEMTLLQMKINKEN